jgi:hypothetical protein
MECFRAFSSELLKMRRSWAFTLSIAAPLGVTLLIFLLAAFDVPNKEWNDVWIFYLRGIVWSWVLMMLPFYVALLLALIASIDHNAAAWKVLLAQPVSRPPLYVAKLAVACLLVAWSNVVLATASLALGFLLRRLRPDMGNFGPGVDLGHFLAMLALAYVAGLLMIAIHAWLSMRSSSFVLSLAVVIFAVIPNFLGFQQEQLQKHWPWLFPFDAVRLYGLQPRDTILHFWSIQHLSIVSVLGAALVTSMAIWDFSRREAA